MENKKFCIARHINNISLNGYEYLLEREGGDIISFDSENDAVNFLNKTGKTEMSIEDWSEEGIHIVTLN